MLNKVVVIATHPDDETLGCGGTILKYKQAGDKIYWIIATSPQEEYGYDKDVITKETRQIEEVAKIYNFDGLYKLDLRPTEIDHMPLSKIVEKISIIFKKIEPTVIFMPFINDVHSDHRVIFNASFSCIKSFRCPSIRKALMMEILSETEFAPSLKETSFSPNYFVDITSFFDQKLKIMEIFQDELSGHPFPRSMESIKALATIRGSQANCTYAESFILLKGIWR